MNSRQASSWDEANIGIAAAVRAIDARNDEREALGNRAEMDNMYSIWVGTSDMYAKLVREFDLLRRERDSLELERDCALLEVDRLADRVNSLEEWSREPLVVRKATS